MHIGKVTMKIVDFDLFIKRILVLRSSKKNKWLCCLRIKQSR